MATWSGYYIEVTGLSALTDMGNTTTTGTFSIVGPFTGDSGGDNQLRANVGDTIDGQEVVGMYSMGNSGNTVVRVDGVDYTVTFGFLGFELADGRMIMSPNFGSSNEALRDALAAGGDIDSITLIDPVSPSSWNGVPHFYTLPSYNPVCFGLGTLIDTPGGPVPVESLGPGDVVLTRDGSARVRQVTRWIGPGHGDRGPVRIAPGALGPGQPQRPLTLSHQHRVLIASPIAARMFGTGEVLVPARLLLPLPGVTRGAAAAPVRYVHFSCARHEVVRACGAWAESLFPGSETLKAHAARGLPAPATTPLPARPIPTAPRARKLVARHLANGKPLVPAAHEPA